MKTYQEMELVELLRKRAKEIGPDWSDYKMLLDAADEIEGLRTALREAFFITSSED